MANQKTTHSQIVRHNDCANAGSCSVPAASDVRLNRTSKAVTTVDLTYHEESHTRKAGSFTVTNMTPKFSRDERAKVKRDIKNALYQVFSKYNERA